jgi:thiamine pyrophosphokinase
MDERVWVLLAAGEWCALDQLEPWLASAASVVACDGALDRALALGLHVDVVVGDMDSVDEAALQAHLAAGGEIWSMRGQENNDLAKALEKAAAHKASRCVVAGATGGDLHHTWANLLECSRAPMEVVCLGPEHVHRFLQAGNPSSIEVGQKRVFSVFTPSEARGVSLRGATWELDGAVLQAGSQGVHNQATKDVIEVSFESGKLLILHGYLGD